MLGLADRLRADGIDTEIDQYNAAPPEGWPLWCERQIGAADVVMMVCTETYHRRVSGDEERGKGLGVVWEAQIIRQLLYDAGAVSNKFVPVLFSDASPEQIPTPIKGWTRYVIDTEDGYEELYRRLTGQPRLLRPALGTIRALPPRRRQWPESTMVVAASSSPAPELAPTPDAEIGQERHKRKCFVISPIGQPGSDIREQADALLECIIVPALERIASEGGPVISPVRSDKIGVPGRIEEHMLKAILSYDLCIVDLSGLNPNVMYELAIAQAAGRPVVLMCRSGEMLPFDVQDYRTIVYDLKPLSISERIWVPKVIEQVLAVLADDYEAPSLLKDYDQIHQDAWSSVPQSRKIEYSELFSELSDAGISSIYKDREHSDKSANAESWLEREFRQFRSGEVLMMGVSLRVFFHKAGHFYHVISEMLDKNQNAKLKVLVCDPYCPAYSIRTKTETSSDLPQAIRDIQTTIASFSRLGKSQIDHRIYTEAPYCTIVIFPDKCYFSPNILSSIAPVCLPVIIFKQESDGYERLKESFDCIWELSRQRPI